MKKILVAALLSLTGVASAEPFVGTSNGGKLIELKARPGAQKWQVVSEYAFSVATASPAMLNSTAQISGFICTNPTRVPASQKDPACNRQVMLRFQLVVLTNTNTERAAAYQDFQKGLEFSFVNHPVNVGYLDASAKSHFRENISMSLAVPQLSPGLYKAQLRVSLPFPGALDELMYMYQDVRVKGQNTSVMLLK
jgi:hypothetical protein